MSMWVRVGIKVKRTQSKFDLTGVTREGLTAGTTPGRDRRTPVSHKAQSFATHK